MDEDTYMAACYQLELEARQQMEEEDYNTWLAADPAWCEWLDSLQFTNPKRN